jgi:hypothetical protein
MAPKAPTSLGLPLAAGLPRLETTAHLVEYTPAQQAKSAAIVLMWAAAFFSSIFCTYVLAVWVSSALASLHPMLPSMLGGLLVAFCGVSAWEATRPVDFRAGAATEAPPKALHGIGVKDSVTEEAGARSDILEAKSGKEE